MLFIRRFNKVFFVAVVFLMISCGASIEADADAATELTFKSLEYIKKRELEKSEEAYQKSKLIQQKYTENSEAFYNLYMSSLEKNRK